MNKRSSKQKKLRELADIEGMNIMEMLEEATYDAVARGICMNCDYTTQVEPDQDAGWCENCNAGTVKSCLVLAEMI